MSRKTGIWLFAGAMALIFVAELAGGVGYVAWLALTLFHAM